MEPKSLADHAAAFAAAGLMTVTMLPEWYRGLKIWHMSEDGEAAVYRHPTKKATLGRCRPLRVGQVIRTADYNARRAA